MPCLSCCERAVTNDINVTSCVDEQCVSFQTCQIETVAQFGTTLKCFCLPASFLSHQVLFFFLLSLSDLGASLQNYKWTECNCHSSEDA